MLLIVFCVHDEAQILVYVPWLYDTFRFRLQTRSDITKYVPMLPSSKVANAIFSSKLSYGGATGTSSAS